MIVVLALVTLWCSGCDESCYRDHPTPENWKVACGDTGVATCGSGMLCAVEPDYEGFGMQCQVPCDADEDCPAEGCNVESFCDDGYCSPEATKGMW